MNHDVLGNQGVYDPAFLQSAYDAPSATNGDGQTVAVVDAYDAPNVAADLAVYRTRFGLAACTVASGCFRKVDQNGGTAYPVPNASWARETTLDVQMVSALCPRCDILLVEANSNSLSDLGTAVNRAVAMGADVVSNSYGASEFGSETFADHYFDHPGVAIVASSGDDGYGVSYPAASPHVVAVGGTSLHQATATGTRDATETVWSGAGSGCSAYEPKPAWQTDTGCAGRSVADVSAVADPSTGVWVYNSADGGWEVFGGTSVAAPVVGALYALAGNAPSTVDMSSLPYATPNAFNDVVSGSNGACGGTYLCTGVAGYDGPTGWGTPNGAAGLALGGSIASPPPDFSVSAPGLRASLRPGATGMTTVTVTPHHGFTGNVAVSVATSPATRAHGDARRAGRRDRRRRGLGAAGLHRPGRRQVRRHDHRASGHARAPVHLDGERQRLRDDRLTREGHRGARQQGSLHAQAHAAGAFRAPVSLSLAGLPARDSVIYARNPAGVTSTQVVTITTTTDARGSRRLRFTGVSGVLRHTVVVVLTVQ